ncbi:MAG: hypothetical protein J07HX5_02015 [halophilic archaeon J07HX5]|nr:MAG: hypothetical protein J07HX5_02015 [halophilic archaeon J07HX5]
MALRYFACTDCATVVARPDPPSVCGCCGATTLEELSLRPSAAAYFGSELQ